MEHVGKHLSRTATWLRKHAAMLRTGSLSHASTAALFVAAASCSCSRSPFLSTSALKADSQSVFNSGVAALGGAAGMEAQMRKIAASPIEAVYAAILNSLPNSSSATITLDALPISVSRQKFLGSRAAILAAYGHLPLSAYLASRHISLTTHGTYSDLKTALDLLHNLQPPPPALALTVNCEAIAYSGDALTIGGAVAAALCAIPLVDTIACPVAAGLFTAGGVAVSEMDLAACHINDPKGENGLLKVANNDGTILRANPNLTLCQIDPSAVEYDTAGKPTKTHCSAAEQQSTADNPNPGGQPPPPVTSPSPAF